MKANTLTAVAIATALLSGACGSSSTVWVNGAVTLPIPRDAEHQALLFPVGIRVNAGDSDILSASLAAGILSEAGDAVLPGAPLEPLLESAGLSYLSWDLGVAMYRSAFVYNAPNVWGGSDEAAFLDAIGQLEGLVGQAAGGEPPPYLLVAHIDSLGSGLVPGSENWRVFGGLFHLETQQIHTAFYNETTVAADAAEVEIARIGQMLASMPFCVNKCDQEGAQAKAPAKGWRIVHFR